MQTRRKPRLLVVEDLGLLLFDLVCFLKEAGYDVVASTDNLGEALWHCRNTQFDAAVLDWDLGLDDSAPIAAELSSRNVPFILVTAMAAQHLPADYADKPRITKPYTPRDMRRAVAELVEEADGYSGTQSYRA